MHGVYRGDEPLIAGDLEQLLGRGARAGGGGSPLGGAHWSPGPAFGAGAGAQPAAGEKSPRLGACKCPVFEPSEADIQWVRERFWGGGDGPLAGDARRDPCLGTMAGAHTADRPKFSAGRCPVFEPAEEDLEWVRNRKWGGSAGARRLGSPHRPPAPTTRASGARRTRDGEDTRRPGAMRPSPIAEAPPPTVAGGAGMGALCARSPGVASPPGRPPGSTAAWRQRQASPGLHHTLPSCRGGVAGNPPPFARGGALLAHTSARSPEGATTPYSPPDSAMVSRLGRTSPGLHHPPPSRGGGGANGDGALWRATRDSNSVFPGPQRVATGRTSPDLHHPPPSRGGGGANSAGALWRATRDTPRLTPRLPRGYPHPCSNPVGGGSPGPRRAARASQVVPGLRTLPSALLDAPHVAPGCSSGGGGPLSAGAPGSEDTTRPLGPALGGGGVVVGVPRISGATSRDSLRGGLRRSGRRKVPQSAQGRGGMLYPRPPPPQLPRCPGCREQQPPCETPPPPVTCGGEGRGPPRVVGRCRSRQRPPLRALPRRAMDYHHKRGLASSPQTRGTPPRRGPALRIPPGGGSRRAARHRWLWTRGLARRSLGCR